MNTRVRDEYLHIHSNRVLQKYDYQIIIVI
ncbi:hypothetical protein ERYG_05743 [Escherichia coli M114]|nr:hypothetical protein ERYG_05743 [Escherichia coli M114]